MKANRMLTLFVVVGLAAGMVIAAFIGVGPGTGLVVLLYFVATLGGAYLIARLRGGDDDIVAIVTGRKDERQVHVDNLAGKLGATTCLVLCGVGAIVSLARGDSSGSPFLPILGVSGIVYIASMLVLRSRA